MEREYNDGPYECDVVVENPSGLHAAPAGNIAVRLSGYEGGVEFAKRGEDGALGRYVDAHKPMQIMTLAAVHGEKIHIRFERDGKEARDMGSAVQHELALHQ